MRAANVYAHTFPDSAANDVHKAPADYPNGKFSNTLAVEFTALGVPCIGLNGGPIFKHSEAPSLQIETADQADPDPAVRRRVFAAMMTMGKIDVAAIEAARKG